MNVEKKILEGSKQTGLDNSFKDYNIGSAYSWQLIPGVRSVCFSDFQNFVTDATNTKQKRPNNITRWCSSKESG